MFGRTGASLVGVLGGALVVIGGIVAGALTFFRRSAGLSAGSLLPLVTAGVAIALGIVVFALARPRIFWWPGRRSLKGVELIAVGAITWILVAANLLIVVGAALAILAGLLFVVQGLFSGVFSSLRRVLSRL